MERCSLGGAECSAVEGKKRQLCMPPALCNISLLLAHCWLGAKVKDDLPLTEVKRSAQNEECVSGYQEGVAIGSRRREAAVEDQPRLAY